MSNVLRIANAHAFWGDDAGAAARLAAASPALDWITLDYLAEVSMSILAKQRERDPSAGYARDFLDVVESLIPLWNSGHRVRIVTNAGGLNPAGCAAACAELLKRAGCGGVKIGVVSGDDVLGQLRADAQAFRHLETGDAPDSVASRLVTANAYLGAAPIVGAILAGAAIVITGRVADPSLTVAPCIAHFGWSNDDYASIAGATVAGHLIECGTQVTGGISTDWLDVPDAANIGFPIAEVAADGSCVIAKPPGTGGRVSEQTIKEQLLYEIGDPARYLSPDATVSFLTLRVSDEGNDRVRVSGATGSAPPATYKVSATFRAGFRASGTLTVFGRDAVAKAKRCGVIVLQRLKDRGCSPRQSWVECLGAGAVAPGVLPAHRAGATETVLRITVADDGRDVVERFTRELMPLISAGPQGITGYAEGRPVVREVFGYWPTLIARQRVQPRVEMIDC
ncbi:MAG TPA: acyclic terpene utilization AtuA family protein [Tepidisphaeraceae bacterium]|nr:acyclic terpene utilization AtuA family protein [Tepidisphaeraceae bacterium]